MTWAINSAFCLKEKIKDEVFPEEHFSFLMSANEVVSDYFPVELSYKFSSHWQFSIPAAALSASAERIGKLILLTMVFKYFGSYPSLYQ